VEEGSFSLLLFSWRYIMDQTKFINSYIANLAERLKALTLDNIMLNTQLSMANETNIELSQKIQVLETAASVPEPKSNYMGLDGNLKSDYKYTNEDEAPYSIDDTEHVTKDGLNVNGSNDSTDKKK
jgi:cell division protein FtsB